MTRGYRQKLEEDVNIMLVYVIYSCRCTYDDIWHGLVKQSIIFQTPNYAKKKTK